jgi:hypothetical protein
LFVAISAAVLIFLAVAIFLVPVSIGQSMPPQCWSVLGVPSMCDPALALAISGAVGALVGLGVWRKKR